MFLLTICMIASWSCETQKRKNVRKESNEITLELKQFIEDFKQMGTAGRTKSRGGGGGSNPSLYERINVELLLVNISSIENLTKSIERFDDSSTKLSYWMLFMSVVMTFLVAFQVVSEVWGIKELWRGLVKELKWIRKLNYFKTKTH